MTRRHTGQRTPLNVVLGGVQPVTFINCYFTFQSTPGFLCTPLADRFNKRLNPCSFLHMHAEKVYLHFLLNIFKFFAPGSYFNITMLLFLSLWKSATDVLVLKSFPCINDDQSLSMHQLHI